MAPMKLFSGVVADGYIIGGLLGCGGERLAVQAAGLQKIGWHVARYSFASHLVMRGVPMKVVQELLGHQTIQMTMRYSHLRAQPRVRHRERSARLAR